MTKLAEIPLSFVRLSIAVPAMLVQLGVLITGIVLAIMGKWIGVIVCVGIYGGATLTRMIESRRRGTLTLYEDRIAIGQGGIGERSWPWEELLAIEHGTLVTRDGYKASLTPIGDHKLDEFESILARRGLDAARIALKAGRTVTLFDGQLIVSPDGLERAKLFTPWDKLRINGDDKLLVLGADVLETIQHVQTGGTAKSFILAFSASRIPDDGILRDVLSRNGVKIGSLEK